MTFMAIDNEERKQLLSSENGKAYSDINPEDNAVRLSNDHEYKRRWASIILSYFGILVFFFQSSLFWSSLWPYLSEIDQSATETFFGFVIAAFSFGTVVASPIIGYWSNRLKSFRWPVVTGFIINIVGNVLFAFAESFDTNRKWVLLSARLIAGFGASGSASLMAYVPAATTMTERNAAMSYQAATTSLGVLLGPGIQAALVPLGYPGIVVGEFRLNMYTMAAYFSAFCSLISIVLFITMFKEYNIGIAKDAEDQEQVAAAACIWCRFIVIFCVVYNDTIGSPLTMIMFYWTRTEAVLYNGIVTAVAGVVDFCGNIFVGTVVLKYIHEGTMMLVGLTCYAMFYVFTFSYPGLPLLKQETICSTVYDLNSSSSNSSCIINEEGTACTYDWCNTTTRISLVTYLIGYGCMVLGFSTGFAPCNTLFTKVLGPRRQGFMQGLNVGVQSIANTISPIMVSHEYKRRWASIILSYFGILVFFFQSSLFWSSLWPYLSEIDQSATETFFGFVIAAFSFGTVVASPIIGYWSNRLKSFRWPVVTGFIINIVGNVLFAFAESFDTNRKWVLLSARLIAGFGASGSASLMAYVPAATTMTERNAAMSYQAATTSLGVLLGPGIQAALVPLGYPGIVVGEFRLNMYTMAAYFSAFCSLISIVLFITMFKEYNIGIAKDAEDQEQELNFLPSFDVVAAAACIWCRFIVIFCVVYNDTIGSPLTMIMFYWTRTEAVLYNGIVTAVAGVVDFCGNIFVGTVVLKYIHEGTMMLVGLTCYAMFYVFTFSYPGLPLLKQETICSTVYDLNSSSSNSSCIINEEGTACTYDWCNTTTRISLVTYLIGYGCMVLGFSTGFAPCNTLFTKVLGPRRQGFMQGLNVGVQSIANTISPIMVSAVFQSTGPCIAWLAAMVLILATMVAFGIIHKRLVPFDDYLKRIQEDNIEETQRKMPYIADSL